MFKRKVDVAIIGTGTAGMGAYREARKHTDSIALIEGGHYGTTCARVGCMPSKLLIAAAEAAHGAKHAGIFGLNVPTVETDGSAVLERVKRERDRFVGFVVEDVDDFDDSHKVRGYARFLDAHRLQIDNGLEITADRIVIATGSRPFIPEVLEGAGNRLLVNDDVFELEHLPSSVLVVGTGVIGLELGQALSRLNVKVTMLSRNESIGGIADSEIRKIAANTFQSEFDLALHAEVLAAKETLNGVQVTYRTPGGIVHTVVVDYVLAATGRIPNTDKLGLESTGIVLDARGVPVSDRLTMQTSAPHIFIAGDANNELPLLHEASDEGRIAGSNAGTFPTVELGHRRAGLGVVFSDPQIASVGKRAHELVANTFITGKVSFHNQGRSRVMAKNQGMLKVYADKQSGILLGAEMFGPAAEHIGHLLAWAVQQSLTVHEILGMPFYHPVIEEGVRTAFRDASDKLKETQLKEAPHAVA
ncbi:dihydrolipoyl dehydrogenase [Marinobacter nauticus]|uniref:dihydrolipoyl dehydrogenase n=1 Tax=Marinobacter nauticus TaxID=2743 RepID=UPI001C56E00B|nr:dihydrolipoyl dehydrogenase [Marinobacter nauticus]MBW3196296.1 dihydrolipoyl dehydrogenase [Marinobacter nauticus]MBY6181706.1 dihydrolipoyl dehydrogenase [Marinobacter nauticus]